jgi:mannose-6-phosphate isomerase-like protein (cupin superfamily)
MRSMICCVTSAPVEGPSAAQRERVSREIGMIQHHQEHGVVARGERAALGRHHFERFFGIEMRRRQQARAARERGQQRERAAGDVVERPRAEIAVACAAIEAAAHVGRVAQHIVVSEHHALRVRRGAGRELHQQHVARIDGLRRKRACAPRASNSSKPIAAAGTSFAEHHDVPQHWKVAAGSASVECRANLPQHVDEIDLEEAVDDEQQLHVRLLQAIFELVRLEARVDRHRHAPSVAAP